MRLKVISPVRQRDVKPEAAKFFFAVVDLNIICRKKASLCGQWNEKTTAADSSNAVENIFEIFSTILEFNFNFLFYYNFI